MHICLDSSSVCICTCMWSRSPCLHKPSLGGGGRKAAAVRMWVWCSGWGRFFVSLSFRFTCKRIWCLAAVSGNHLFLGILRQIHLYISPRSGSPGGLNQGVQAGKRARGGNFWLKASCTHARAERVFSGDNLLLRGKVYRELGCRVSDRESHVHVVSLDGSCRGSCYVVRRGVR
jgi:hypothetical protein